MSVMDSIHQSYLAWTWDTVQDYGGCSNALLDDPGAKNGFPAGYYSGDRVASGAACVSTSATCGHEPWHGRAVCRHSVEVAGGGLLTFRLVRHLDVHGIALRRAAESSPMGRAAKLGRVLLEGGRELHPNVRRLSVLVA